MKRVMPLIIGLALGLAPAVAATPDSYPMLAPLTLPAGPVAVELPPAVVASHAGDLAGTLRLQDAEGVEHPFAVRTSRDNALPQSGPLRWAPEPDAPETLRVDAADQPIDGIAVRMDTYEDGPWSAQLEVPAGAGWAPLGEPQLIYAWQGAGDGGSTLRDTVTVPHRAGPFRVTLRGAKPARVTGLDAVYFGEPHVAPASEAAAVEGPVARPDGGSRYTIRLPGPREVSGLALTVTEPIFARDVTITAPQEGALSVARHIERAEIGDVHIDASALTDLDLGVPTDTVVVDFPAGRDAPLHITGATVASVGALLLAPDAGPAPQTLYFGGTEPDVGSDVSIAADELARVGTRVPSGGVVPAVNPAFVPRPTRTGLDLAGAPLNLAQWRWERAIVGGPGWVRVAIAPGMLAHGQPGMGDLRVVDADGRSVPYTLQRSTVDVELTLGEVARAERGGASELTVPLPDAETLVSRVELSTDQPLFSRDVAILRDRGAYTETLRSVRWDASAGGTLAVDVGEPLQGALLIRIQNGDDAPLPIRSVRAFATGSELRVRVPDGGARLVYGNRRVVAPDFDLTLIEGIDATVPTADATLGPEQRAAGPARTWLDTALIGAAFAGLAAGLVALSIGALRRRPVPDSGSAPNGGASPADAPTPSQEPAP